MKNILIQDDLKGYWDRICTDYNSPSTKLLRAYSDLINIALFQHWLADGNKKSILKTDLFDEAFHEGLYPALRQYTDHFVGIDISKKVIDKTKSRYPDLQATQCDVRDMIFDNDTFDCVISNSTLDHFKSKKDIVTGLEEIRRVMNGKGSLLITFDNLANPLIFLRSILPYRLLNKSGFVPYYVGKTLDPIRLKRYLSAAGFEVLEVKTIMHFPRVLILPITKILNKFFRDQKEINKLISYLFCFEKLSQSPVGFFTGHFVAARAIKRD